MRNPLTANAGDSRPSGVGASQSPPASALAVSELRYRRLFETAKDGILILDAETGMVYTHAEIIGRNPRLLKSGRQDAEFYRRMWAVLGRGEVWSGHLTNRRKDGALYEEDASISPVRAAAGKVINYVAVKRDVTHEAELEQQLRQAGDIQLLLTDVVMPGMDGRQLAQRLGSTRAGLRVLFMSGYTADVIAQRGVLEKGMAFIAKPFSRDELGRRVHDLLAAAEGSAKGGESADAVRVERGEGG